MSDLKALLERADRAVSDVPLPADGLEALQRRRDRKRRNQRITAGVVGIAVFVAAIWIVTSGGSLDRSETPAVPGGPETGPTPAIPAGISDKLLPIVKAMPGFISMKSCTATDGEEIGVIRFASRTALDGWAHEGEDLAAQAVAPEIYEYFWVQDAETYREYTWKNGVHTDGDLTGLFA